MRILVVEDEVGIARSLERGFTADGFEVDVAYDGTRGHELAAAQDYDVIVLDIMLPGMNGHEVCHSLRRAGDTTPILMLTAKDTDAELAEGLDTGADDYVIKPFSYVVLLSRIRALIRRARQVPPSRVLDVGDLHLDLDAHVASRAGTPIDLSPRALAVLGYLMASPDQVLSKESILNEVWDHSFNGDANIVEVYVSRLRRAIDGPFGRETLQTVRGLGYRLASSR